MRAPLYANMLLLRIIRLVGAASGNSATLKLSSQDNDTMISEGKFPRRRLFSVPTIAAAVLGLHISLLVCTEWTWYQVGG